MNELQVQDFHGKKVIDSREVAVMVEKQHKNLLADIRSYIAAMGKSNELKIQPVDFFIPSTYQDGKGETRPCYLLTKKGCDMVANKTTGEKGVLFSAAYVSAFEEMRQALTAPPPNAPRWARGHRPPGGGGGLGGCQASLPAEKMVKQLPRKRSSCFYHRYVGSSPTISGGGSPTT